MKLLCWVVLCSCLALAACKKSNETDEAPVKVTPQLNLTPVSSEAEQRQQEHLAWHNKNLVEAYNEVGHKDRKWDVLARDALKLYAKVGAYGTDVEGFPMLLVAYAGRAVEEGCNDPMIKYLLLRYGTKSQATTPEAHAAAAKKAAEALENSGYSEVYKFYAFLNALDAHELVKPVNKEDRSALRDKAVKLLRTFLQNKSTSIMEAEAACEKFLEEIKQAQESIVYYELIEPQLRANWPETAMYYLIRGKFYINLAWQWRTGKSASKVTKEQWEKFYQHLETASEALEKAWELDPRDSRIAERMVSLCGPSRRPEMEAWFQKGFAVDPSNFRLCNTKLNYLQPKWGGSQKSMIAFGRECVEKGSGRVPLILAEAHYYYNRSSGAKDGSYWHQENVWQDVKMAYEKFFELNPNAQRWRANYARFAYWCQQWETLDQQLQLMGDDIDYAFFGGRDAFDQMKATLQTHLESEKVDQPKL